MPTETSNDVITRLKSIFACHSIPQEVRSDNGPQFSSNMFKKFSEDYNFTHTTSSPRYPASNGEAERAVRTVKEMLKKCDDPYLAMLIYRSTPLHNGFSPAELLMGRKLRTTLPILPSQLEPSTPDYSLIIQKESEFQEKQKQNFDSRHCTRELVHLLPGDNVYLKDGLISTEGQVIQQVAPRSYNVTTPHGTLRRNRRHLHLLTQSDDVTITRTGRVSRKPLRYRL